VKFQFCITTEITLTYPEFLEYVRDRLTRWSDGRYRLIEAAQVLSDAYPGELDTSFLRKQIEQAIRRGKLAIRKNGIRLDGENVPSGPLGNHIVEAADLNEWLTCEGARYRLSYPYLDGSNAAIADIAGQRVVPKAKRQKELILDWLVNNGYEPTNLPAREKGKGGPKAQVRAAMLANPRMFSDSSFEKAWGGLRSDKAIMGAD
jgi:hypothetical protein